MTQDEALEAVRAFLKAKDEGELTELVSRYLPSLDGTFFSTAQAAIRQLEQDGKSGPASALRSLADRMLSMRTLI